MDGRNAPTPSREREADVDARRRTIVLGALAAGLTVGFPSGLLASRALRAPAASV